MGAEGSSSDVLGGLGGGIPGQPGDAPPVALEHLLRGPLVAAHEAVDVEQAVEVVGLVLQAAREETAPLHLHRLAVCVHPGDPRPLGPAGREVLGGYREAPLLVLL